MPKPAFKIYELDRLREVGVAVLGCGYWGVNHVRVFDELPEAQLVLACDQSAERRQEVRRRFRGLDTAADLEEGLANDEVEAVVVCTEASSHFEIVRRCLRAGKHVLVEKPITITAASAGELGALAAARGLTLMVGHTFLYNPGIQRIREYVQRGEV